MSIAKMKKVKLIAMLDEREELLKQMMHMGCVEVSESTDKLTDAEWAPLVKREASKVLEVRSVYNDALNSLSVINKYTNAKGGLFILRSEITEEEFLNSNFLEKTISGINEINELERKISYLYSKINKFETDTISLSPWKQLDMPLEMVSTEKTVIHMGVFPSVVDFAAVKNELLNASESSFIYEVSSDKEQIYVVVICHKADEEDVLNALKPFTFTKTAFKEKEGTALENIALNETNIKNANEEIEVLKNKIINLSDIKGNIEVCIDRLSQEMSKETVKEKLLETKRAFFLEGWALASQQEELEAAFNKLTCAYEFADPGEDDAVPTKLVNSKIVEPLNMVTEMYSLPSYDGIDPNPLIFGFFIFFFGFMFADLAYGLIIFAISIFITKKYKPKGTIGYMFRLGIMLGLSTAVCGVLTGGFFGDAITVFSENFLGKTGVSIPSLINPLSNPMQVLMLAIVIGFFQLMVGMCIKIYMSFRDGEPMEGILDVVPWWFFFIGVGVSYTGGPSWVIIASLVVIVLTQGRHAKTLFGKLFGGVGKLYDVTSWLSDILSYARLMALMLATSVIASVVNILGSLSGNIVVFIVIFLIGHVFNIGINIIGTYVHAARLQYLEFFGKFYKEGGIPFKPLSYNTKYVDIVEKNN